MINNSSEGKDFQAKQESNIDKNRLPKTSSTSRQLAGFKNPRIVRVSRTFGGKDRHSKVCTVKGLRDRRIRLSVPTAIQLYDLQDRLGLSQPSKVVDWLIDATSDDIDKLPPLQMPMEDFSQFHLHPTLVPQDLNSPQLSFSPFFSTPNAALLKDVGNQTLPSTKQGLKLDDGNRDNLRKGKEAIVGNKWDEPQEHKGGNGNGGLNIFPMPQSSYSGLLPYNSYYNLEPSSNLSLSQFGNQGLVSSQMDASHNCHSASLLSSSLALPSASQFFFCPSVAPAPSVFPPCPPYFIPTSGGSNDPIRQVNNFQLLSSSSQHVQTNPLVPPPNLIDAHQKIPFGLHVNSKFYSQSSDDSRLPDNGKE